jgi:hypothetical protein
LKGVLFLRNFPSGIRTMDGRMVYTRILSAL